MSETTPTRAAVLELKDEQRAMHEGYVFLDEKCLLLAGEILRQLARHADLERGLRAAHAAAMSALQAALARHGLEGLQVQPAAALGASGPACEDRALMGVRLQEARWRDAGEPAPAAVNASPEVRDCRAAWPGNPTSGQFLVQSWEAPAGRLLACVNYGPTRGQCWADATFAGLEGRQVVLSDLLGPDRYERDGTGLAHEGLYLDMPAWGHHVFEVKAA